MISLSITGLKKFMSCFLGSTTFDHFLVSEASITTNVTYQIDGRLSRGFYSPEELDELSLTENAPVPFSLLKPVFFDLIRGTHTPVAFKFVLALSPKNLESVLNSSSSGLTPADVSGLFVNFRYQDEQLVCVTGISYQTFSLGHILDEEWDQMIRRFLLKNDITFEELS